MSPHGIMTASLAPRRAFAPRHRSLASASQPQRPGDTRKTNLRANSHTSAASAANNVEDSASVEDLVPQGVPDPPHNPDPPRSHMKRPVKLLLFLCLVRCVI